MKRGVKNMLKRMTKVTLVLSILAGLFVLNNAMADASSAGISIASLRTTFQGTVSNLAVILTNVALIAGIGFILAAFFKFHQHKLNPTQVPISQGVTLLLIGAGLALFPVIIPTTTKLLSSKATVSTVGGSGMTGIIGGS